MDHTYRIDQARDTINHSNLQKQLTLTAEIVLNHKCGIYSINCPSPSIVTESLTYQELSVVYS